MAIKIFENQHIIALIGTKADQNLAFSAHTKNKSARANREAFLKRNNLTSIIMMETLKNSILWNPQGKTVRAHGIISDEKKAWGVYTSDCPPLIVINPKEDRVGLLHLGWQQVYRHLIKKFFSLWLEKYPQEAKESLEVFVGPGICSKCFTLTGPKGWFRVLLFYMSPWRKYILKDKGVYSFDMKGAIREQLLRAGLKNEQIHFSNECTFENLDLSSYRREGKNRPSSNLVVVAFK